MYTHTVATVQGENLVILEADVIVTIPFTISGRIARTRAFAYTQDNTATAGII